jgi:hypothetical protein
MAATSSNLMQRIHTCKSSAELNTLETEKNTYTAIVHYIKEMWEREIARRRKWFP